MFFSKKLKEFENIRHCFFSRKNGFSEGYYKSLNCGLGSNDKKENVLKKVLVKRWRKKEPKDAQQLNNSKEQQRLLRRELTRGKRNNGI